MAPTPRKRPNVLPPSKVIKKIPSSRNLKGTTNDDCNNKSDLKTKCKNTSITSSPQSKLGTSCRNDSIKSRANGKRNLSTENEHKRNNNRITETAGVIPSTSVDEMNVQQLLALGEQKHVDLSSCSAEDDFRASTDSDSDFEEVKNVDVNEPVIPKEGVNITLEVPNVYGKKKKMGFDLAAHLKRQMNRVRKDLQLLMHKVHVLCWIAHLRFMNNTLNDPTLLASCTSLVKSKNLYPSKYSDLTYLEGILKWFHKNFVINRDCTDPSCTGGLLKEIEYQIKQKQAYTSKAFTLMFIILLRILGLKARVVMSFQVLPVKPSSFEFYSNVVKESNEKSNKLKADIGETEKNNNLKTWPEEKLPSNCLTSSKRKSSDNLINQSKEKKAKLRGKKAQDPTEINSDNEFESEHFKPSLKLKKSKGRTDLKTKAGDTKTKPKVKGVQSTQNVKLENTLNSDEDEDKDFTPKSLKKKIKKVENNRKVNTSEENIKKKEGSDVWTEVYLEAEEKWLCVDVTRQKIHCVSEIYSRATHPVVYIIACNNDGTLKDVTKRYVPSWHSDTRKKRVDDDWWNETMKYFLPTRTPQDREEDEDINRQILDQPLPSSISEFKDHPVYALKRHLLKFEAIYPPDAPTLGFVRGEPVYARECVVTLHSREMWYKQARLVRLKEEPYKIVKARPKYDKMTGEIKKDLPLELFGRWQTEDYIPPVATDGKVPRNEYGNVDLFKPCMLPIGTVHLQIPALNKIAKKLDIDCAAATVGFDFHSGGSHPVFDGFVVCEEFKDVLLDAWNKEIDESSKKQEEKKEKRVYGNWKRLIRGLLIREKLKTKYAFGENSDEEKPLSKASTSSK